MFPHTPTALLPPALVFFQSPTNAHTIRTADITHNSLTETDKHHCTNINKRRLFHWYMCTGGVPSFLWHELNMPGFQARLPVVVWLLLVNTPSSSSLMHMYLLRILTNKLSVRLFFQKCTPVTLWRLNIDSSLTPRVLSETQFEIGDRSTHFSVSLLLKTWINRLVRWG